MLVKYANFVKIQPIAPYKRVRPKASNLLVILIEPLSFRLENLRKHTLIVPLTYLAKHAILTKFSGLNLKSGSHLIGLLHITV